MWASNLDLSSFRSGAVIEVRAPIFPTLGLGGVILCEGDGVAKGTNI